MGIGPNGKWTKRKLDVWGFDCPGITHNGQNKPYGN